MRAAVIEDQTLVREYLVRVLRERLGVEEVVQVASMAELQETRETLRGVELVLFDIDLGDGSTLDWAVEQAERGAPPHLVALSSILGALPLRRLQAAGISMAHKNDGEAELVEVVRQTLGGAVMVSRGMRTLLATSGRDALSPAKLLGPREQEVLGMLGQRLSSDEIAEVLGCAPSTVLDHRKRIMRKLELHSIEEVIDYAIAHGAVFDSAAMAAREASRRASDRRPR